MIENIEGFWFSILPRWWLETGSLTLLLTIVIFSFSITLSFYLFESKKRIFGAISVVANVLLYIVLGAIPSVYNIGDFASKYPLHSDSQLYLLSLEEGDISEANRLNNKWEYLLVKDQLIPLLQAINLLPDNSKVKSLYEEVASRSVISKSEYLKFKYKVLTERTDNSARIAKLISEVDSYL